MWNDIPAVRKARSYQRIKQLVGLAAVKVAILIIEIAAGILRAIVVNGQIAKVCPFYILVQNIDGKVLGDGGASNAKRVGDGAGNRRSRVRKIRVGDSGLGEGGGGEEVGEGEVLRLGAFGLEPDGESGGDGGRQQDEAEDSAGGGRNATTDSGGGGASTASAIRLPQNGRNCKRRRRRIGGRLRGFGRGRSWFWGGSDGSALRGLVGCGIRGIRGDGFGEIWRGSGGSITNFPIPVKTDEKKFRPKTAPPSERRREETQKSAQKNHCHRGIFLTRR